PGAALVVSRGREVSPLESRRVGGSQELASDEGPRSAVSCARSRTPPSASLVFTIGGPPRSRSSRVASPQAAAKRTVEAMAKRVGTELAPTLARGRPRVNGHRRGQAVT